ncbi:type 2 lanthipeptide synthetase LanM [Nocardiopsis aegyptia]|uniref:Type 2 lantibiotic biosynthesis protein LanM n=1 Tax=Nocardiopsis aegyptia TaxID=220378 RepID=A0A7Z0JAT8_9ACTN|nr:type 2 lanthipeptide synthetase LanM [Nocardiopsis aegyptia]NYJ35613.1 type 2 lantibiotic biosynthesis protein LanM [Nocardiopsis aegyptia]
MAGRLDGEFLQGLVDECVDRKRDVFGGFYRSVLSDCARRMRAWDEEWFGEDERFVDLRGVAESVLRSVLDLCDAIGVRTLITVFRSQEYGSDRPPLDYHDFHDFVSRGEGRGELLGAFPELSRLFDLAAGGRLRLAEEILRAAWNDRRLLGKRFGTSGPIVSLELASGDSHRGGRTTSFVRWYDGTSVVYKPQRRSCHRLLDDVRALVDEDRTFFGPLCPESVTRAEHMWQRLVSHTDVDGERGAEIYFRRFGRAAALLSMLGASDLHHENVIATAEGPVVVDIETLVTLPHRASYTSDTALAADVEASVLNTMLFAVRSPGSNIDIDISAIGNVQQSASRRLSTFLVVDAGTDDIRFDEVPAGVEPGPNMATDGGERLDPRKWADDIVAGFQEACDLLSDRREEIKRVVRDSGGWSIRQILRPTFLYFRFLTASTHPAYLRDRRDREVLFDKLPQRHRGVSDSAGGTVCAEETQALLDLDIPFFEVGCDSRALLSNGGEEIPDAVLATPREAALARVDSFLSRPPARDSAYIRYALASSVDDLGEEGRPSGYVATAGHKSLSALNDRRRWHDDVRALVVGGPERPTWLMPTFDGVGFRLDSLNTLVYEEGGLLLYFAAAAAVEGEPVLGIGLGDAYTFGVRRGAAPSRPQSLSPFTGALSQRVTGLELERAGVGLSDPLPGPTIDPHGFPDVAELGASDFDYLNGFGGYLVYTAEYDDPDGPRVLGLEPERLLTRLVEVDGAPEEHSADVGLAHGRFGRITAMSAMVAGERDETGRARKHLERFAAAYLRHRWTDEALETPSHRSGWCKGYAGVAFAMTKLLRALGHPVTEVREAIAPEVEHVVTGELGRDLSLCHGVAGRIAVLCWLADRLDWPELRTEARKLNTRFLEEYADGGWSSGAGVAPELASFMLGVSGWHFTQMMIDDSTIELPACLGGR